MINEVYEIYQCDRFDNGENRFSGLYNLEKDCNIKFKFSVDVLDSITCGDHYSLIKEVKNQLKEKGVKVLNVECDDPSYVSIEIRK